MDLNAIFTTQTILQSIVTGIIVWLVRLWLETEVSSLANNKKWTGLYLPTLAIMVSLVLSFLFPFAVPATVSGKLTTGLLCGFCSSYLFSALKGILSKEADK